MDKPNILKHVRFTQTHIDILDNLIENTVGIDNYAEAIRYAVISLEDNISIERKVNAIGKNIDILMEMTGGGFQELGIKAIGNLEDTFVYMDAKKNVENKIQRSTTIKSNFKKSNIIEETDAPLSKKDAKPKPRFTI